MLILDVCEQNVITVTKDTAIQNAAKLMKQHNIGNIVVVDQQKGKDCPIGILTDRDIAIKITAENIDLNSITVADTMSENLFTLKKDQNIKDALVKMCENGVRRAPVVDENNHLVGIATVDDLLVLIADELSCLASLVCKQGANKIRMNLS